MRIYRDRGFVILENIAAYSVNQLVVELIGNTIRIAQLGSNRGEIRVSYTAIQDFSWSSVGETPQEVLDYIENTLYGDSDPVVEVSKNAVLTLQPPASSQYTVYFYDVDATVGDVYMFIPDDNSGELTWNAIIAYGSCKVDGTIEVNIQAPTGLIVGDYDFKYKRV